MSRDTQADYKSMKPYIDIAEKAKTDAKDAMDKALGKKANILRRVGKWPIIILRKVK